MIARSVAGLLMALMFTGCSMPGAPKMGPQEPLPKPPGVGDGPGTPSPSKPAFELRKLTGKLTPSETSQLSSEILRNMDSLESYRATATGKRIALTMLVNGNDCAGQGRDQRGKIEFRIIDVAVFVKAEPQTWRNLMGAEADPAAVATLSNRWVLLPAAESTVFKTLCSPWASTEDQFRGKVLAEGLGTFEGKQVYSFTDAVGTLYVSAAKPHVLVAFKEKGSTTRVTSFNRPITIAAPPPSEVLDLGNMAG